MVPSCGPKEGGSIYILFILKSIFALLNCKDWKFVEWLWTAGSGSQRILVEVQGPIGESELDHPCKEVCR
jgi:hypothetical protein